MNKQNKTVYIGMINRMAIAMLLNQGILLLSSLGLSALEVLFTSFFGKTNVLDAIFRIGECAVYFWGFIIPVIVFNKMNNKAEKEIYEPVESDDKLSPVMTFFAMCIGLGATTLASYANFYIVDIFSDYSDFTQENFWAVELEHPYQIVIYCIYAAVIPAVVEELLFRGTLCRALKVYGKTTAVIVSAVLFALMHTNIEQLLYTLVAGILLGWIYVNTENVIFPIILHFVNNGISVVGDIIAEKCSPMAYSKYQLYSEMAIWVLTAISLTVFLVRIFKKGSFMGKLILKPDENGEEVAPLSAREKVSGFFSGGMTVFVLYAVFTMIFYIYLSTL